MTTAHSQCKDKMSMLLSVFLGVLALQNAENSFSYLIYSYVASISFVPETNSIKYTVEYELLAEVIMKSYLFCHMMPYSLVEVH
jgi:hypothetical protein